MLLALVLVGSQQPAGNQPGLVEGVRFDIRSIRDGRWSDAATTLIKFLDDHSTRRAVDAERSFMRAINAGCHTPVGALATVEGETISLHAQLFSEDSRHMVEGVEVGADPHEVGPRLAGRLVHELEAVT